MSSIRTPSVGLSRTKAAVVPLTRREARVAFEVVPGAVREHAEQVRGQGDVLAQALDAARQVSMSADAMAESLKATAEVYEQVESDNVDRFDGVGRG
jgi:hypothetical protein